jgi:hypothetical protein
MSMGPFAPSMNLNPSLLQTVCTLAAAGVVAASACSPPRAVLVERGPQAYYQTAYPVHDTSEELARLFLSVKQVIFNADYRTYAFREDAGVTEADVRTGAFQARADSAYPESVTKSGTATVVARSGNRVRLLSTDHVARFAETRIHYWDEVAPASRGRTEPRRVSSVSVLVSQQGTLLPPTGTTPLRVLARSDIDDLALLEAVLAEAADTVQFPALRVAAGDARRLSWGSFVYVVGYPRSTPMVTRAIVSDPDRDKRGGFVTDGLWNEGISGGLILAVRGDTGEMEAVGIARAGVGEREIQLRPDTTGMGNTTEVRRYDGPLYLQSSLRVRYGITLPVSMTVIKEFLSRNGMTLRPGVD